MNLNVLKWHARRKLRPLLRPLCWLSKHKRGVLKHNFPAPSAGSFPDERRRIFECPRCLRTTEYVDKAKRIAQTSPADGSPHFAAPAELTRAHRQDELKKIRGEA